MTIENGRFVTDSADEILSEMISAAETAFDEDFSDDEIIVIRSFYRPIAEYLAGQQNDLREVLDNAQIEHAEGEALDLLGALIGLSRNEASPATVRQSFYSDSPVTRNYSIPEGTVVQTDEADPIEFDTDYVTSLKYIDGFEDGDIAEYSDSTTFSAQQSTVYDSSWALEADASGVDNIINAGDTVEEGSRIHYRNQLQSGTIAGFLFAVEDDSNHYRLMLDSANNDVYIEAVESGTAAVVGSKQSVTLPTGEWLHVDLQWDHDASFTITVNDAAGSELTSFTVSESTPTFRAGGVGFRSGDTTASKFWDHIQMQRVSVDATAVVAGGESNVSAETLTILNTTLNGVDITDNPIPATGGRDRETDEEYRDRAQKELGEGIRATQAALINRLRQIPETRSVTVIANDTSSTDGAGRPSHSFEAVVDVDSEYYLDVAERIIKTKAAGDIDVGGYAGTQVTETVELVNGQTKDVVFSTPSEVTIYVDVSLTKTSDYAGDDRVQDSIVKYIGGVLNGDTNVAGDLSVGEDVVYNRVLSEVMDVPGVVDVSTLEIDTSDPPSGTSNISISNTSVATTDATDGSITVSSSDA